MRTLVVTDRGFDAHVTPPGHPERVDRLVAVRRAWDDIEVAERLEFARVRPATVEDLRTIHSAEQIERVRSLVEAGGGHLDPDTAVSTGSWDAALGSVGAVLAAVDEARADRSLRAFCAVRPPGHHATPNRAMGFCLFNNVAVGARALAAKGERVAIVDIDVHHGNGTQDAFFDDPDVLFASFHQWPFYPGTGSGEEVGTERAWGSTINVPLPSGSDGATYLAAVEMIVGPALSAFDPTVILISAGFDTHRSDPLASMTMSSADIGRLVEALLAAVGNRADVPVIAVLEGGYDLDALWRSTRTVLGVFTGSRLESEEPTGRADDAAATVARLATRRRRTVEEGPHWPAGFVD